MLKQQGILDGVIVAFVFEKGGTGQKEKKRDSIMDRSEWKRKNSALWVSQAL